VSTEKLFAGLVVLLATVPAHAAAPATDRIYCCEGNRFCSDSLPPQCRGKAYRILDRAGNTLQEIGPPMTAEQKAEAEAAARRKKELEELAKEQRRKDQALLDTYAVGEDIDRAQATAEADVIAAIKDANARVEAAQKQRKKLEQEAEFYKGKALPAELAKAIRAADHDIKTLQELGNVKTGELAAIKAKYDADRKRYGELTGKPVAASPPAKTVTPAATPGR
jgi:DNA repair exonuclease SbcCD ATPase subunit